MLCTVGWGRKGSIARSLSSCGLGEIPSASEAGCGEHNLEALPLVVGLLATGDAAAVRAAFGAEPEGELPVPEELRADVESVSVVPPKQLHTGG